MESTYRPRRSEIGCRAPLTVTVNEALALIGIGRTKLYELIAEGRLETTSIGRRRLVKFASVERLLEGPVPSKAEVDASEDALRMIYSKADPGQLRTLVVVSGDPDAGNRYASWLHTLAPQILNGGESDEQQHVHRD